jgi:hypothetical protein
MLLGLRDSVFAILLVLWLGGCVNSMTEQPMRMSSQPVRMADQSIESYTEIVKGFDRTLTEAEKRAIISELQTSGKRHKTAGLP